MAQSTFQSPIDTDDSTSRLRPYLSGITNHADPIATIILFKEGESPKIDSSEYKHDYLANFELVVEPLFPDSFRTGVIGYPELPAGKVPILTLDNKNDYYGVFNNFSVTGISESHDQISKVHMNFSAKWNVFFFGNTPNVYQFRGYFLDTMEYPYYQEFLIAFEKYLSGRKAVEQKIHTKLMVSGQIIDGYLLSLGVTHNAQLPAMKEFQFSMLVKGVSWVRYNYVGMGKLGNTKDVHKTVIDMNALSNIDRLSNPKYLGLIDHNISEDTSGKSAPLSPLPTQTIPAAKKTKKANTAKNNSTAVKAAEFNAKLVASSTSNYYDGKGFSGPKSKPDSDYIKFTTAVADKTSVFK